MQHRRIISRLSRWTLIVLFWHGVFLLYLVLCTAFCRAESDTVSGAFSRPFAVRIRKFEEISFHNQRSHAMLCHVMSCHGDNEYLYYNRTDLLGVRPFPESCTPMAHTWLAWSAWLSYIDYRFTHTVCASTTPLLYCCRYT